MLRAIFVILVSVLIQATTSVILEDYYGIAMEPRSYWSYLAVQIVSFLIAMSIGVWVGKKFGTTIIDKEGVVTLIPSRVFHISLILVIIGLVIIPLILKLWPDNLPLNVIYMMELYEFCGSISAVASAFIGIKLGKYAVIKL